MFEGYILTNFSEALNDFFDTIVRFYFHLFTGMFRALLPCGWLPRKSVAGKVVLITGSGSGLGRLLAIEFAQLGARLVLWDINAELNAQTKQMIEEALSNSGSDNRASVDVIVHTVDLSQREQIYATAKRVRDEMDGDVEILINNAGIVSGKKLFDCSDSLLEKTMAVNANALFYMAKAFLPAMFERNNGHYVTIASMAGHVGVNGLVDYCASKHAAVGFNEALRSEISRLGKSGVHVTTINPYYVRTGMFTGIKNSSPLMFPILEPCYVVNRILEAVLTNAENVYMPRSTYLYLFIKGLFPARAVLTLAEYFGLNRTMEDYIGRCNK
jgi:all-trans-retinol dehydrogenase (NAD+)